MLDQHGAEDVGAHRRLCLAGLACVEPASLAGLEGLGLLCREGGLQALLDPVLDDKPAVLLDPGHNLGKHREGLAVRIEVRRAQLAGGGT